MNIRTDIVVLLLLLPALSFAQFSLDFGGGVGKGVSKIKGIENTSIVPVLKVAPAYQFDNGISIEALMQSSITKQVNRSCYFGVKAGYNLFNFIPSIGYLYDYKNADDTRFNKWNLGYALKYVLTVNRNGGFYLEGMYAAKTVQLTTGFNIKF